MSHLTYYRSFWGQFYGSDDPTNSVTALKDNDHLTRSRANPTSLSSLKGKANNTTKVYSTINTKDTQVLGRQRAKPNKIKAR